MTTTEIDYKKLFQMFCGNDPYRPVFHSPFKQQGRYFATDAHSMIFLPMDKAELDFKEVTELKATAIIPKESNCNIEINVADIERQFIPNLIDDYEECIDCDGEGEQECDLGHMHDCDRCEGDGNVKKHNGKKVPDQNTKFEMLGTAFTYKQLRRFLDAINLIGTKTVTKKFGEKRIGNYFEAGDFGLIIMPYKVDDSNELKQIIL